VGIYGRFYKPLGPSIKSTNAVNFTFSLSGLKKVVDGLIAEELTK